ncbi:MAG: SMI1/KNR4 family protein [Bacillota bacterium]
MKSTICDLMAELDELLEDKVSEDLKDLHRSYKLRKGASEESLDQFEKKFGVKLPDDFRGFYGLKDGSGYAFHILYPGDEQDEEFTPFYLMSLEEMEETKSYFCERDERLDEYYSKEEISKLDPEIKPFLFHKRWFPFASMAGGSLYLMLDFDPAESGDYGQVIVYVHDPDFIYYVAKSFTELLKESNHNLKTNIEEIEY